MIKQKITNHATLIFGMENTLSETNYIFLKKIYIYTYMHIIGGVIKPCNSIFGENYVFYINLEETRFFFFFFFFQNVDFNLKDRTCGMLKRRVSDSLQCLYVRAAIPLALLNI